MILHGHDWDGFMGIDGWIRFALAWRLGERVQNLCIYVDLEQVKFGTLYNSRASNKGCHAWAPPSLVILFAYILASPYSASFIYFRCTTHQPMTAHDSVSLMIPASQEVSLQDAH